MQAIRLVKTTHQSLKNPQRNREKEEQPVANSLKTPSNRDVGQLEDWLRGAVLNQEWRFSAENCNTLASVGTEAFWVHAA
jgi:hypothetical protein